MKTTQANLRAARLAYIDRQGSIRELGERFGIARRTLERVASREGWRTARDSIGGDVTAIAGELAVTQGREMAERLSLPERSAKLREAIVGELERDAGMLAKSPPKALEDSAQRQAILRDVSRTASLAFNWEGEKSVPCLVRINVMASARLASASELAARATPPPAIIDIPSDTNPEPRTDYE